MSGRDPMTHAEWQEAVDAAQLGLEIESCKMYGLLTGPNYDVERCEEILRRGKEQGIVPNPLKLRLKAARCA